MSLPVSSSDAVSSGFYLLDERIQRWIWQKGWTILRDAQERAIPALVGADRDVIIAAATAAGKTEAAFLPILTNLLAVGPAMGSVLYVSPLKALINDQWGRLDQLCEELEVPVVPWHGDIAATKKNRFLKEPRGVLLITPESLEAVFVRRGHSLPGLLAGLRYIVVDELHAFIGVERGKQLQSLMHRVEALLQRRVSRVGLSATLGDMNLAADFLRPGAEPRPELIVSGSAGQGLKVLVRGIEQTPPRDESMAEEETRQLEDLVKGGDLEVAAYLYKTLRGENHLVFPNSRRNVELYSDLLRRRCERESVPNEFWPHHGNLSKDIREQTETALKTGDRPATAICTSTLEMGIDIGSVKSIAQIGPPPSVASLRQRLGRSGRREGESSILRAYCLESPLDKSSGLPDRLRQGLVQTVAMVRLLVGGWFEPPRTHGLHASTLVQQLMSLIAERGGVTAATAWHILVNQGPFAGLAKPDFVALLRALGGKDLIVQSPDGLLLHGAKGEQLVNHYEFYSAFISEDEFRILCEGKALGSLPISRPILPDSRIIFAGRRWRVIEVDADKKIIVVVPDPGGAPPDFEGGGTMVHDRVRQEMKVVLESQEAVAFLDEEGKRLLNEGRRYFADAGLADKTVFQEGKETLLLTWRGDWANDALVVLLDTLGVAAINLGVSIAVTASEATVRRSLEEIAKADTTDAGSLLEKAMNLRREKWDWALPEEMLRKSFASSRLDLATAKELARKLTS